MLLKLKIFLLAVAVLSCQRESRTDEQPLNDKLHLNETQQDQAAPVDYLVRLDSEEQANEHISRVKEQGGDAELLKNSKTIVKAKISGDRIKNVDVPETSTAAVNAPVKVQPRPQQELTLSDHRQLADAVMTAKKVVGVDKLRARKAGATGKGVTVAVFDTGIDFGLRGVSDGEGAERKLKGFFDLTDFGRTKINQENIVLDDNGTVAIGEKELRVAKSVKVKKLYGKGVLSEAALAKAYLSPTVDLNGNEKFEDEYLYVVGTNDADQTAVWIDVNNDGKIDSNDKEEMTDFNTTGKYVLLRADASPVGAKPLAITVHGEKDIQFHSVEGGHGTSCAIVIGGSAYANGHLFGMAPEAQFVSYMLDVSGQDVYTVDQFMEMFLHAREQKVDAISISWGFTVANLESARFFSKFLDDEIAAKGILIGIAAGNEGPATSSGYTTDYMPHNGFAVGAMVSKDQAKHVYGWNGQVEDSVIWYSSFGPTRGGRQVPDVISPLMTMVRGERQAKGSIFRGFGGTSSATPALIGAMSAVMSQLKVDGVAINPRLLKVAVENSAAPIEHVQGIRQGRGVLNVDAAYDLYLKLQKEFVAAKADKTKSTRFAYELRAETKITGLNAKGEGLVLNGVPTSKSVHVAISKESLELIDSLDFAEPLNVTHEGDFLSTNDVVLLQASGASFSVEFDTEKLSAPGVYQDTIRLVREDDGVALLNIPVVVRIADRIHEQKPRVTSVNRTLTMNDQWRSFIHLTEDTALNFKGAVVDQGEGYGTYMGFYIQSLAGDIIYKSINGLKGAVTALDIKTPTLVAGQYELVTFRGGSRPAVVTPVTLSGVWQQQAAKVTTAEVTGDNLLMLVEASAALKAKKARFKLTKAVHELVLHRDDSLPRKGFVGKLDVAAKGTVAIHVSQNAVDQRAEEFLNVSMAISNAETASVMYRGWVNFYAVGNPRQEVKLTGEATAIEVLAYPNIVDWKKLKTQTLNVQLELTLKDSLSSEAIGLEEDFASNGLGRIEVQLKDIPAHGVGQVELLDKDDKVVSTIDVQF